MPLVEAHNPHYTAATYTMVLGWAAKVARRARRSPVRPSARLSSANRRLMYCEVPAAPHRMETKTKFNRDHHPAILLNMPLPPPHPPSLTRTQARSTKLKGIPHDNDFPHDNNSPRIHLRDIITALTLEIHQRATVVEEQHALGGRVKGPDDVFLVQQGHLTALAHMHRTRPGEGHDDVVFVRHQLRNDLCSRRKMGG